MSFTNIIWTAPPRLGTSSGHIECPEEGFEQELNLFFSFCAWRVMLVFWGYFSVFQCFSVFRFPMVEEGVLIPTGRYNTSKLSNFWAQVCEKVAGLRALYRKKSWIRSSRFSETIDIFWVFCVFSAFFLSFLSFSGMTGFWLICWGDNGSVCIFCTYWFVGQFSLWIKFLFLVN